MVYPHRHTPASRRKRITSPSANNMLVQSVEHVQRGIWSSNKNLRTARHTMFGKLH